MSRKCFAFVCPKPPHPYSNSNPLSPSSVFLHCLLPILTFYIPTTSLFLSQIILVISLGLLSFFPDRQACLYVPNCLECLLPLH